MVDLIADLRRRLTEGLCLCSSAHTDWRGVEDLLDRLERAEAERDWFRKQADHHIGRANRAEQALGAARAGQRTCPDEEGDRG